MQNVNGKRIENIHTQNFVWLLEILVRIWYEDIIEYYIIEYIHIVKAKL